MGSKYCLDFGPHFFITQKQEIVERITDLVADEVVSFERSAQLHVQGRFLDYPLSAKNVLLNFPPGDAIASVATFLWAQLVQGARRILKSNAYRPDVGAWAATNFGSHLALLVDVGYRGWVFAHSNEGDGWLGLAEGVYLGGQFLDDLLGDAVAVDQFHAGAAVSCDDV